MHLNKSQYNLYQWVCLCAHPLSYYINEIIIYNRTDCCADRLSNYQVSISNKADFSTHTYQQDFHVAPNPKHQCCHPLHNQQQRGCGVDIYWIVWQVFQALDYN
jgi:hypothetical protein